MPDTLEAWLTYLESLHPKTIELGLDRVRAVKARLGLELACPVIIVGGTNGKGSTCAFLEAILSAAGYKTGLYTSPHLLRYNERVRVGRCEAGDAALCAAFAAVEAGRGDIPLTYFEFGTLAATWQFSREQVDVAVLEVGLGGRLDAVNVFDPDVAIVTSVDLDHQDWLGDTREAIGREKAGIFRGGKAAVCAEPAPPDALLRHGETVGADLRLAGRDFCFAVQGGGWDFEGGGWRFSGLPMPALRGAFQLFNASAALAALEALSSRLAVDGDAIRQGLRDARVTGRFQVQAGRPEVILDVAHNPHAARALADNLAQTAHGGKTYGVFAMLGDKDVGGVAAALAGEVDHWLAGALDVPRAQPVEATVAAIAAAGVTAPVEAFPSVAQAFRRACELAGENDRIAAFGSFYTVAEVLRQRPFSERS